MLSFIRIALLALFATAVVASPSPTAKRMTNGERLARGLPLAAPHRRSTALKARHSAQPPNAYSPPPPSTPTRRCTASDGVVEVFKKDGTSLGYLHNTATNGTYGLCSSRDDALPVHPNCDNDWFEVPVTRGHASPGCGNLGGIGYHTSVGLDLTTGSSNHAACSGVASTQSGSFATAALSIWAKLFGEKTFVQSNIWTIDVETNELIAGWVNSNSQRTTAIITYVQEQDTVFFTADLNLFAKAVAPQTALEVTLKFSAL
ncbi:hypothetical protein BDW22DRAFT_1425968 [Trametopsis cervina]|nr:hypothetical protein BDW22DRAFT_1425968 [Trametopsis cervina]